MLLYIQRLSNKYFKLYLYGIEVKFIYSFSAAYAYGISNSLYFDGIGT